MTNYSHIIQDFEAEKAIEEAKAIIQHKTDNDLITFILDSEHFDGTAEVTKNYIETTLRFGVFNKDVAEELITNIPHDWRLWYSGDDKTISFKRLNPLK